MHHSFSLRIGSFLMTGCSFERSAVVFHSVTTAKLPPVRNAVTIASLSLAASSASSILSEAEDVTRKYRAPDSSTRLPLRLRVRSLVLAGGFVSLPATAASAVSVAIHLLLSKYLINGPPALPSRRAASRPLSGTRKSPDSA